MTVLAQIRAKLKWMSDEQFKEFAGLWEKIHEEAERRECDIGEIILELVEKLKEHDRIEAEKGHKVPVPDRRGEIV